MTAAAESKSADSIRHLTHLAREFVEQRNWQAFQSPKNLSMGMIVEAAELVEHFQWLTESASRDIDAKQRHEVGEELADILVFLLRIAEELEIDLGSATVEKIKKNCVKYPLSGSERGPLEVKRPNS